MRSYLIIFLLLSTTCSIGQIENAFYIMAGGGITNIGYSASEGYHRTLENGWPTNVYEQSANAERGSYLDIGLKYQRDSVLSFELGMYASSMDISVSYERLNSAYFWSGPNNYRVIGNYTYARKVFGTQLLFQNKLRVTPRFHLEFGGGIFVELAQQSTSHTGVQDTIYYLGTNSYGQPLVNSIATSEANYVYDVALNLGMGASITPQYHFRSGFIYGRYQHNHGVLGKIPDPDDASEGIYSKWYGTVTLGVALKPGELFGKQKDDIIGLSKARNELSGNIYVETNGGAYFIRENFSPGTMASFDFGLNYRNDRMKLGIRNYWVVLNMAEVGFNFITLTDNGDTESYFGPRIMFGFAAWQTRDKMVFPPLAGIALDFHYKHFNFSVAEISLENSKGESVRGTFLSIGYNFKLASFGAQ